MCCFCVLQPEPFEFLKDKQQQVLQRVASTAAQRVARSFSRQHSSLGGVGSLTRHSSTARALSALSSLTPSATQQAPAGAAADHQGPLSPQASSGGVCLRQLSARQLSLQLQRSVSITADGRLVRDAVGGKQQQQDGLDKAWPELAGCEQEFHLEVCGCADGWCGLQTANMAWLIYLVWLMWPVHVSCCDKFTWGAGGSSCCDAIAGSLACTAPAGLAEGAALAIRAGSLCASP